MLKDFKAFVLRGNVMDLAVAVIIGGAFGKIVSSFVADVIMPAIGVLMGGVNLSGLKTKVGGSVATPVYLNYGVFLQAVIDFLLIALVIFLLVRMVSKFQKPAAATDKVCQYCRSKISIQASRCPHCTSQLS